MFTSVKENPMKNEMADEETADIRRIKNNIKDDVRRGAQKIKGDVEELAHDTGTHIREAIDTAKDTISDTVGSVTNRVREKPVSSTLIALGIGFVVGSFFRRG